MLCWTVLLGAVPGRAQEQAAAPGKALLQVSNVGGMCEYGQCHTTLTVYQDGTAGVQEGPLEKPVRERSFEVDQQDFMELIWLIETTDFESIRATKFTGTCPTAYDGAQYIYTFSTNRGKVILDSCENVIDPDSDLFKIIHNIQRKAYSAGGA
ncbi:MAG: hypothetical protein KC897_04170 [Candidatus Omnitrophica bacterium]|nr:hypothetical protein [Candidatus Omnitrophota bacterium]MCB9721882.1 hypothetical protein [Candidatus Omnitrophota bacterium]